MLQPDRAVNLNEQNWMGKDKMKKEQRRKKNE
jgi:hypothetical protein